jgi:DNA-binding transcriptional LysR family regulator
VDRVLNDEVELGFVGARLERPGLTFQPFAKDELVFVVSPDHPLAAQRVLSMSQLTALPLIFRESGSGTRASLEALLQKAGIHYADLTVVAELGSTEAVVRGVRSGMGVGVVSMRAVAEELRTGLLARISLKGPPLERTFYVVQREGRPLSQAARTFVSFLMAATPCDERVKPDADGARSRTRRRPPQATGPGRGTRSRKKKH